MSSDAALKLLEDNNEVLRSMCATLSRIEILLGATPKGKRPKVRGRNPYTKMIEEERERAADQIPLNRTRELWLELCPANPQPIGFDLERKQRVRDFWSKLQGEDNVRAVFATVAADDWLSGRLVGQRGRHYSRPRGPVSLWEVIDHPMEILEKQYK